MTLDDFAHLSQGDIAREYLRLFEQPGGQIVLAHLRALYCGTLFHTGPDGARLTDFSLGANAVVDWIETQMHIAKTGGPGVVEITSEDDTR